MRHYKDQDAFDPRGDLLEDLKPHNSILYIWIKAGIGGFIAMLFMFGASLRDGARAILDAGKQDNTYAAFTMMSVAYVLMVAIYGVLVMRLSATTPWASKTTRQAGSRVSVASDAAARAGS